MDERPTTNDQRRTKENPVQRRHRVLIKWRLRTLLRTIPKGIRGETAIRFFRYAQTVAGLSNRQRERVVLPWLARPFNPMKHPDVQGQLAAGRKRGSARRMAWALAPAARVARGKPRPV